MKAFRMSSTCCGGTPPIPCRITLTESFSKALITRALPYQVRAQTPGQMTRHNGHIGHHPSLFDPVVVAEPRKISFSVGLITTAASAAPPRRPACSGWSTCKRQAVSLSSLTEK